jgi:prenyltransferase beta subunit
LLTFSLYCISRKTVDTEYTYYSWCMTSTDIVKWRKTNDYEHFEKGMIYMTILKKGGGRWEKGGGGNEIHAPCACGWHLKGY